MGGSYGGYATLAGVAFTPDLYAAAVDIVGPSNLITLIKSFPAYWGPFMKIWHLRWGNPDDPADREDLMARSPLFSADQIKTPLFVIQGANDPRVLQAYLPTCNEDDAREPAGDDGGHRAVPGGAPGRARPGDGGSGD